MTEPRITDLSDHFRSDACYGGVNHVFDFSKKFVMPVLQSTFTLTKSTRDRAIIGTYLLAHGCLETVTLMNRPSAFQGVGSAAKTLFELAMDLKMLCDDKTDVSAEKYFAYPTIERHKTAKRALEFYSENGVSPEMYTLSSMQEAVRTDVEIQTIVDRYWPGTPLEAINHWSTKNKVPRRMEDLGIEYQRMYYEIYTTMNWYDHPNPVSWVGKSLSAMFSGNQMAFMCVIKVMTVILFTIKDEFRFELVVQQLTKFLHDLIMKPAEIMVKELEKMKAEGKFANDEEPSS